MWDAVARADGRADDADLAWLGQLPAPHTWPLDGQTLRFLWQLVAELRPSRMVEFGSGLSTAVLARAGAQLRPQSRITTMESDPFFVERTRAAVGHEVEAGVVDVRFAPLVVRRCHDGLVPAYLLDRDAFGEGETVDLVLIDGPSSVLGGRAGALYQALELAAVGTLVLLDDFDRDAEASLVARWRAELASVAEFRSLPSLPNLALLVIRQDPPQDGWWWLTDPTIRKAGAASVTGPGGGASG